MMSIQVNNDNIGLIEMPFYKINNTEFLIQIGRLCSNKPLYENVTFKNHVNEILSGVSSYEMNFKYYTDAQLNSTNLSNSELSLFHLNVRSLNSNYRSFVIFLQGLHHQFDIIMLSEINSFNIDSYNQMLTGYNFYYCLPVKSKRGGVGMYLRCELSINERKDLQIQKIEGIENLWYDVACGNKIYVIGGIYKHPKYRTLDFIDKIEPILNKISSSKNSSLIAGDFNIDLSKCNSDKITGDCINMLFSNNFQPTIIMPTRITPKSAT